MEPKRSWKSLQGTSIHPPPVSKAATVERPALGHTCGALNGQIGLKQVPGCGSGPFGTTAVDYQEGLRPGAGDPLFDRRWKPLERLPSDRRWVRDFEGGLDWLLGAFLAPLGLGS